MVEVGSLSHDLQGIIHPRWLARFLSSTVMQVWHTYGLCKGKPTTNIAENKVQHSSILQYLKFLVIFIYPRFDYLLVGSMILFSMFQLTLAESYF